MNDHTKGNRSEVFMCSITTTCIDNYQMICRRLGSSENKCFHILVYLASLSSKILPQVQPASEYPDNRPCSRREPRESYLENVGKLKISTYKYDNSMTIV